MLTETKLKGVYIYEPKVFGDNRGWFMESYSERVFNEAGLDIRFVQDNHSYSAQKGVLRGLHFQKAPMAQSKLLRVLRGTLMDVVVDIRKGSPTFGQYVAVELSADNKKQIFMPKGMAHGFVTLTDDVEVHYKVDEFYAPETEGGIIYNDPDLAIDWGTDKFILSDKDKKHPTLKECTANFVYGEI